jgi:hypothetical protein
MKQGWTYLLNSRKWHYFTSERNSSLCGKFMLLRLPDDLQQDNNGSPDNCVACRRALEKQAAVLNDQDA